MVQKWSYVGIIDSRADNIVLVPRKLSEIRIFSYRL